MLKSIPLVIRLRENDIYSADLAKELKIDRHRLDRELEKQPGTYAFWASMFSEASASLSKMEEEKERLEAKLHFEYRSEKRRPAEIKLMVKLSHRYRKIQKRIRRWEEAVNILKYAVKAFEQRKDVLMAINANTRKEKEHTHD